MDLLSIDSLSDEQIATVLDRADTFLADNRAGRSSEQLAGRIVFNLFYEASTRTLMSFATAAHRLGASVVTLPVGQSSVNKGETLEDTARTLGAMRPDLLVIRHSENGSAQAVAEILDCPVINAGDGTNEHPTQAMLDAATIRSRFGRIDGADVVMMLRVQRERLSEDLGDGPGEYLELYGLTEQRLATAARDAIVMHPGPMNRGVEIGDSIADDPERSLIALQVEYGVAVRMACLELLTA